MPTSKRKNLTRETRKIQTGERETGKRKTGERRRDTEREEVKNLIDPIYILDA